MNTSKQTTYTASQFTLGDLREIINDHEWDDDDDLVDIAETAGDRPFESSTYRITIRKAGRY